MTIDVSVTANSNIAPAPFPRDLYEEQLRDIERFEIAIEQYLAGEITEDVFRVMRLNNGIYGQRQGGTNQMVRIKLPAGSIRPDQLELMAELATDFSRGWGHITTRQNIQFHFVELRRIPDLLRKLAAVGLTSREACGDTVRNVMACHLAGACPHEKLDVTPWAEATFRHFVRNPIGQRLPRKFKVNFSGCSTDCGQAMFNDVGVVAVSRETATGEIEHGFRVYIAGGLGATPHPALALEDFTRREDLLPTIEATLRVFDQTGNRDNKLRARLKWVVDQLGIEEVRRRVIKMRHTLPASSTWPGGIPPEVVAAGDLPAGRADFGEVTQVGQGVRVDLRGAHSYRAWEIASVVRGAAKGTVSAIAYAALGDITADSSARSLRSSANSSPTFVSPTVRTSCSEGCARTNSNRSTSDSLPSTWRDLVPNSRATSLHALERTRATSRSPSRAVSPVRSVSDSRKKDWLRSAVYASTSRDAPTVAASTTPPTSVCSVPSVAHMARHSPAINSSSVVTSVKSRSTSETRHCVFPPRPHRRPLLASCGALPRSAPRPR
ncbi:MAG: nitrite/sulfite reductase, partial [Actinobacteria bacterium]|nr:nitrite/sulfite reductase [Actinomycetota bacterium]